MKEYVRDFEEVENLLRGRFDLRSGIHASVVKYLEGEDNHAVSVSLDQNPQREYVGTIILSANFRNGRDFAKDPQRPDYKAYHKSMVLCNLAQRVENLNSQGLKPTDVVSWDRGIEVNYEHDVSSEEDLDTMLNHLRSVI
jgi:hypothetical protein